MECEPGLGKLSSLVFLKMGVTRGLALSGLDSLLTPPVKQYLQMLTGM